MTATMTLAHQIMIDAAPAGFSGQSKHSAYIFSLIKKFPTTVTGANRIEDEFELLADKWRRDTQFFSSVDDIVLDPSYQRIIGKGPAVVPFMLRELMKGPDHWYWALGVITQASPADDAPEGDIEAICKAWIDWGKRRGLIR